MLKNAKNDSKFLFLTIKSPKNVISSLVTRIWTKKKSQKYPYLKIQNFGLKMLKNAQKCSKMIQNFRFEP